MHVAMKPGNLFRAKVAAEILDKGVTPSAALGAATARLSTDVDFAHTTFAPPGDFLAQHYDGKDARTAARAELEVVASNENISVGTLQARIGGGLGQAVQRAEQGVPSDVAEKAPAKVAEVLPPPSKNAKNVALRYDGVDKALTIRVDRDELMQPVRVGPAELKPGAAEAVRVALAREGVAVKAEDVSAKFVSTLYSATRNGDGMVKKKDLPDAVVTALQAPRTGAASTVTLADQLQAAHAGDMGALTTQFHGDVPADKRFLVAMNIRSEKERSFLADAVGIPTDNVINLRNTGGAMQQLESDDHKWHTGAASGDIEKLRKAMSGKSGCSVTVLAHYNAGGMMGPMGRIREKPATIGGLPAEVLGKALGKSIEDGRLNLFVCGARSISDGVVGAAGLGQGKGVAVTTVNDGVPIQPHKANDACLFYYRGPPIKGDTGEADAPLAFDASKHASVRDAFVTRALTVG